MLANKRLQNFVIHATDGELGYVHQLYFDDETWAVRYQRARVNSKIRPALLGKLRTAFRGMKASVFGACLCNCQTALRLGRMRATPWAALCIRCQEAADRDDTEALRIRFRSGLR